MRSWGSPWTSFGRESVHHVVGVYLARLKDDLIAPGGDVHCVRESLGLQAKARVLLVGPAALANHGAVQEIPGVELHARLVGFEGHDPPRSRILHARHR